MGYRAMCLFWFDDFLDYVQDYDEILRIDDDCTLDRGQPEPELPEGVVFASSATQGCDVPEFTEGMPELFQKIDPLADYSKCKHPYTNVMWLDVKWALRTRSMKSSVLESRCIQINRWGDLPLWGFYLKLLGVPIHPLHLSYFHGSHKYHIKT